MYVGRYVRREAVVSKLEKLENSCTAILPPMVSVLWVISIGYLVSMYLPTYSQPHNHIRNKLSLGAIVRRLNVN